MLFESLLSVDLETHFLGSSHLYDMFDRQREKKELNSDEIEAHEQLRTIGFLPSLVQRMYLKA
jgi:hypothetical protein